MAVTMYGIPNCDTIKKARTWLEKRGIPYVFNDYKKAGIDEERLRGWAAEVGWETLLNKRGTTFRSIPEEARTHIDEDHAIALMLEHPSMIKRPVLDVDGLILVGFKGSEYEAALLEGQR